MSKYSTAVVIKEREGKDNKLEFRKGWISRNLFLSPNHHKQQLCPPAPQHPPAAKVVKAVKVGKNLLDRTFPDSLTLAFIPNGPWQLSCPPGVLEVTQAQRLNIFVWTKWFLLTLASILDGPLHLGPSRAPQQASLFQKFHKILKKGTKFQKFRVISKQGTKFPYFARFQNGVQNFKKFARFQKRVQNFKNFARF